MKFGITLKILFNFGKLGGTDFWKGPEDGRTEKKLKNCQKIVKMLAKNYQNVVKELSKNCQKAVKKLSKSCHKVYKKVFKNCQKIVQSLRFLESAGRWKKQKKKFGQAWLFSKREREETRNDQESTKNGLMMMMMEKLGIRRPYATSSHLVKTVKKSK
jgi:hypothetical protein